MRLFHALLLALLTVLLVPHPTQAWNNTGHMTVALLAYRQLSDAQKLKAASILKSLPGYDDLIKETSKRPQGVSDAEWSFVVAATWPDWIKGRPGHAQSHDIAKWSVPHAHYINTPYHAADYTATIPQQDEVNLLVFLPKRLSELKATDTPADKRAVALAWMLHLVGDVHQPLHCAMYYSDQFPKGDGGGNSMMVIAGHRTVKLHAYWDDLLGTTSSYAIIDENVQSLSNDPQLNPDTVLKPAREKKELKDWAAESYDLAIKVAYLNGDLKFHALTEERDFGSSSEIPPLPEDYMSTAKTVARRRVALAGYRLADQLKSLLGE